MKNCPDLTGYSLTKAELKLKEEGLLYEITETSAPRGDMISNDKRVVRHLEKDGIVRLTVCSY